MHLQRGHTFDKGAGVSRIIIFGDSNSYGEGLDDPLTQNYGYHLSKLSNRIVVNNAIPSCSNTSILLEILKFNFQPDDLVLIGWTYVGRELLMFDEHKCKHLGAWIDSTDVLNRAWLEHVNQDYDLMIKSFMHMSHANHYLTQKNIKYIQFWFEGNYEIFKLKEQTVWMNNVSMDFDLLTEIGHIDSTHCKHPGPKSHEIAAEYVYNKFKHMFEFT